MLFSVQKRRNVSQIDRMVNERSPDSAREEKGKGAAIHFLVVAHVVDQRAAARGDPRGGNAIGQADGAEVTTIEGLATHGSLTKVQNALWEEHGVQCGYCTPAMVLAMTDLLAANPKPTEQDIRKQMDGIICRCGVYQNVVRAVQTLI